MQHMLVLHNLLTKSRAVGHAKRLDSLLSAVESVACGANLSLTSMGRYMNKSIKARSKIQAINYLLSNGQLQAELPAIYQAQATYLCQQETLYISVDWSSLVAHQHHLLRASINRKGNAMTLYEAIYPESKLGNAAVQHAFLKNLASIIPPGKKVCIISDAGFGISFYQAVAAMGWDYVGRLLTNMHFSPIDDIAWLPCKTLYEKASGRAKKIGRVKLSKANAFETTLYLHKKTSSKKSTDKKRKRHVRFGKNEKNCRNREMQPWLIATSLDKPAVEIMRIYSLRMKIEHDFRDTKDPVHGLGLSASRCVDPLRLALQLMIGSLARFVLWLTGLCLEEKKLHYDFQANSIKDRRVLSLVFLAREAIRSGYMCFVHAEDFRCLQLDSLENKIV